MTTGISNGVRVNGNQVLTATNGSSAAIGNALSTGNVGSASNSSVTETLSPQDMKQQEEIKQLKAKIDALCSKIGKTSSEIFSIFGQNIIAEEKISINECKKRLEALNAAIKDATVNGKLDNEKAAKLAKDYVIALNTGWSIEGLKNQNKKCGKTTLKQRLIEAGCLNKTGDVSIEELEDAIEKYFNQYFNDQIKRAKTNEEKQKIIKMQLQTFGRLLINTTGDERVVFAKAVMHLIQNNRLEGTKAVFTSLMTEEQRNMAAKRMSEIMPEISKGVNSDDNAQIEFIRIANADVATKINYAKEVQVEIDEFFSKISENDKNLIECYFRDNRSVDSVPEYHKELYAEYLSIISRTTGGKAALGLRDENMTPDQQFEVNRNFDNVIREHGGAEFYAAVQIKTAEFIDKHPELLNMSQTEFAAYMDKVSDGQFSKIVKESGGDYQFLKSQGNAASSSGLGLEQKTTQETYFNTAVAVDEKIQQLYQEQSEQLVSFIIEKDNDNIDNTFISPFQRYSSVKNLNATELCEGIAKKFINFYDVLDKYNDLTQSAKDFINKSIEAMSTGIQNYLLNGLTDSVVLTIAKHTNIDLSKINLKNLSYEGRQQLDMIIKDKQNVQSAS